MSALRHMTDAQTFQLLIRRLDDQDEKLDQILAEARKTNGRVTKIEQARAQEQAVAADRGQREVRSSDKRAKFIETMLAVIGTLALVAAAVVGVLNLVGVA